MFWIVHGKKKRNLNVNKPIGYSEAAEESSANGKLRNVCRGK
jgi:hypothetical protein